MTRLLEQAIEAVRQLSDEEQDRLARTIMEIVGEVGEDVYVLSEEEREAIEVGLAEVERGEFATEEEIKALFAKYSL